MRVLVADDDRVSRLAVEDLFSERQGVTLVGVEDGEAAWGQLKADPRFDLLCLDVRMPKQNGIELAKQIRLTPEFAQIPIVLITSASDRDTVMSATRAQVQGFIVKPVGSDTVGRIERVMVAFDASVLEPENAALSRLNVDSEKYGKYLDAFVQQMRELAAQADNLVDEASLLAFQRKCGVCHNAAGVIGSPRVARLVGQAMTDATQDLDRAMASAKLAAYWLQRVAGDRRRTV